jgi:hypothetical protein
MDQNGQKQLSYFMLKIVYIFKMQDNVFEYIYIYILYAKMDFNYPTLRC